MPIPSFNIYTTLQYYEMGAFSSHLLYIVHTPWEQQPIIKVKF